MTSDLTDVTDVDHQNDGSNPPTLLKDPLLVVKAAGGEREKNSTPHGDILKAAVNKLTNVPSCCFKATKRRVGEDETRGGGDKE